MYKKLNLNSKRIGDRSLIKNLKLSFVCVILLAILISFNLFLVSCKKNTDTEVILATTTSTYDSGLLDELLPAFKEVIGYKVKPIAVGTGEAITMGERGEVDVILVHARAAEDKFVSEGYGINRKDVMHNDFVIVGPGNDPASIKGITVEEAFKVLSQTGN